MKNQASLAPLSGNNLLGKYWRLYFAVLDTFTHWFNPPAAVGAATPPCCYTAGICCYLTWKDHYRSFIWCAFNKAGAAVTITHPAVVQPAIQHSRPISSKGSEGRQCMPEHWDFIAPLLSSLRKIHSRGIEKYKASWDLVVQNVKSDVICRKWTLDSISAHLA